MSVILPFIHRVLELPVHYYQYILVFLAAFAVTFLVTPFITKFAVAAGAVDRPEARKVHEVPTPSLGGVAIFLGFLFSILFAVWVGPTIQGVLAGAAVIVMVGIMDDFRGLSPMIKLIGQCAAALVVAAFGIRIDFITHPFGGYFYLNDFSILVTVIWIVSIINMMNLIDGLDGLAVGVASIACMTLFVFSLWNHQGVAAVMTVALTGACMGFLRYNFSPASIFMGDCGSNFLGYMLAVVSIVGVLKSTAAIAVGIPFLVLGVPFYDTVTSIFRRIRKRESIFKADRDHLHHRLLINGFTTRQTVLMIYAVSAGCGLAAIGISLVRDSRIVLLLFGVCVLVVLLRRAALFMESKKKRA